MINAAGKKFLRQVTFYLDGDVAGRIPFGEFETVTVEGMAYPVVAGRLQLGPNTAAGNYTLEVTVVDPAVKGDKGRATQRTAFLVVPR